VTYFTCEGTQNSHSMSQLETNLVFAEANRGENEPQIVFCRCGGYHAAVGPATRLPTRYFDTHAKLQRFHPCPAFSAKFFKCCLIVCKFHKVPIIVSTLALHKPKFTHEMELINTERAMTHFPRPQKSHSQDA
jgi:hypothetical protein